MDIDEDAVVPDGLREVWAAKKHLIVSEDGTTIDFGWYWDDRRGWWNYKYLDEDQLDKVTDAFVVSLLSRKVTSINIVRCKSLTDKAIRAIAAKCPALTNLNIFSCKNLTNEAIKALAAGCPALTEL